MLGHPGETAMLIIRLLCVVIFASLTIYTAPVLMAEPNLFPAFFVALVENVHPAGDLFKTPARRGDHQQREQNQRNGPAHGQRRLANSPSGFQNIEAMKNRNAST
jgi:hypothetical protein